MRDADACRRALDACRDLDEREQDAQAAAHIQPEKAELLRDLRRRFLAEPDGPHPVARVVRSGQAEIHAEIDEEWLASFAQNAEHLRLLRTLHLKSDLVVPLVARERTLGARSFLSVHAERRYGPDDLALARDVAHRAAIAAASEEGAGSTFTVRSPVAR